MESSSSIKKSLVQIFTLLLLFNIALLANNLQSTVGDESYVSESSMIKSTTVELSETVEVPLDTFSSIGILIMIALSSLLGAFFVKDELSEAFKQ